MSGREGGFPERRRLLTEFDVGNNTKQEDGLCRFAGVRVPGAAYVEHTVANAVTDSCDPTPERELYDLGADPFQLQNLSDAPGAAGLEARLSSDLDALRNCAGIAGRDARVEGRPYCE